MVLKNLGMSNTSLGFTAGFTGNEIKRLLAKKVLILIYRGGGWYFTYQCEASLK